MTGFKDVTGTAFIVAEFRAHENAEANPLYVDLIVPVFLDERTKQAANAISGGFPAAEKMVRIRTRYFDDRLDEQLALGCRQVDPRRRPRHAGRAQASARGCLFRNR
jgi:O-methyltransferase involved in polyketide biosynthesis